MKLKKSIIELAPLFDARVIKNTPDALKSLETVGEDTITLILPPDVITKPSAQDINWLVRRMNSIADSQDRHRKRGEGGEFRGRTKAGPRVLQELFGGTSVLIAISTQSLDNPFFEIGSRDQSNALPEIEDLYKEVPDPTLVPPIFLSSQTDDVQKMYTRDGAHRAWVAKRDKTFPFILAYIPIEDLDLLDDHGVVYKRVEAA